MRHARRRHPVRRRPVRLAALPVAALLLALGSLTACHGDGDDAPPPRATAPASPTSPTSSDTPGATAAKGTVPDLTGLTVADARGQLASLDYGMAFSDDSVIGDDSLTVTAQSPAPRTALKTGATVTLTVPGR